MLGIWIGKLVSFVLRLTGRSATSLPGKIALRLSPSLIKRIGQSLSCCIVVTGTNGKTTTTTLIAAMVRQQEPIITNAQGANLAQGIASALLERCNLLGRAKVKMAVLEIDEATLPHVVASLPIKLLVVTNVFRDQLDRYGELDTTLQLLRDGIRQTDATLVINADDPLANHLSLVASKHPLYYGMAQEVAGGSSRDQIRDGAFCLTCGGVLLYDAIYYGQVGIYHCQSCDFRRPAVDFVGRPQATGMRVDERGAKQTSYDHALRGLFNGYNVLAAIATARAYGLTEEAIAAGLSAYRPPTGRMQPFATSTQSVLCLIKNPTGCDSVLEAICSDAGKKTVIIGINDLAADGKDVSWLWDADFEWLVESGNVINFVTTGLRAEDMALRLKYAGVRPEQIQIASVLDDALREGLLMANRGQSDIVYVLTTYTLVHTAANQLAILETETEKYDTEAHYRPSVS